MDEPALTKSVAKGRGRAPGWTPRLLCHDGAEPGCWEAAANQWRRSPGESPLLQPSTKDQSPRGCFLLHWYSLEQEHEDELIMLPMLFIKIPFSVSEALLRSW